RPPYRARYALLCLVVDSAAGRDVLFVVLEQRVREVEHLHDPPARDPVVHGAMLASRGDESAPAQTRQVVRHFRLRLAETLDKLAHRQLTPLAQQLEDPQPYRIAQAAEVLRDEIAPRRRLRELERCFQPGHRLLQSYLTENISESTDM